MGSDTFAKHTLGGDMAEYIIDYKLAAFNWLISNNKWGTTVQIAPDVKKAVELAKKEAKAYMIKHHLEFTHEFELVGVEKL